MLSHPNTGPTSSLCNAGSAGSFTIHLNKKAPKSIKVA